MDWSWSKWVLLCESRLGNEMRSNTNKDSSNQSTVLMSRVHSDEKRGRRVSLFSGWFLQCRTQHSSTCVDHVCDLVWRKTFQKYPGRAEDMSGERVIESFPLACQDCLLNNYLRSPESTLAIDESFGLNGVTCSHWQLPGSSLSSAICAHPRHIQRLLANIFG